MAQYPKYAGCAEVFRAFLESPNYTEKVAQVAQRKKKYLKIILEEEFCRASDYPALASDIMDHVTGFTRDFSKVVDKLISTEHHQQNFIDREAKRARDMNQHFDEALLRHYELIFVLFAGGTIS